MNKSITLTLEQKEFLARILNINEIDKCKVEIAGKAASRRTFLRIFCKDSSFILIIWNDKDEDWDRFLSIGSNRKATSFLLPEIFGFDEKNNLILEEDFGNLTLKKYCHKIKNEKNNILNTYYNVIDALCSWQSPQTSVIKCIRERSMNLETFLWESSYFATYCVSQYFELNGLLDKKWEDERYYIAKKCASFEKNTIHRDFQSENILLFNNKIKFVDYQGARLGPPQYDVASLLFDPYVSVFSEEEIKQLYKYYCEKSGKNDENFDTLYFCALQRLMQASGAYANLYLNKGKMWYKNFLPVALYRLKTVATLLDFPAIVRICNKCLEKTIK